MQQEQRLIIALALSVLVLFVSRMYLSPAPPTKPPSNGTLTTIQNDSVRQGQNKKPEPEADGQRGGQKATPVVSEQENLPATQEPIRMVTIQDPLYTVVLTNHGAKINNWLFKEASGNTNELVLQEVPEELAGLLALVTENESLTRKINGANYEIQADTAPNEKNTYKTPVEVRFHYQEGNLVVDKKMKFNNSTCLVEVSSDVKQNGVQVLPVRLRIGPAMGATDALLGTETWPSQSVVYLTDGSFKNLAFKSIDGTQTISGNTQWAGLQTHYFTVLALADQGKTLEGSKINSWKYKINNEKKKEEELLVGWVDVPIGSGQTQKVFLGPKEEHTLKSVHPLLPLVVDYGWFRVIAEPLLAALRWIHSWVANYGMAIILLTFLITLALFPLRYKQLISMKKMQKIQPQVKAVQERYKKAKSSAEERQKMNTEMMALYKQHGVNPVGGCLPLLLQFPFFFAFNSMMNNCFELRGAHFFLWIRNLAAPDPYYITPLIMGLTMYLSMKITTPPSTGDPMQNKMMSWMMPGVMTFMFLGLSAGLNLYFLFSNIFSIALQKAAERFIPTIRNT
jgi:YidC/Oxa1 family membrane protein insertase